jgi:hypothetical protein
MHRKIPTPILATLALFVWHLARKRQAPAPAPAPAKRFWEALKPRIMHHR